MEKTNIVINKNKKIKNENIIAGWDDKKIENIKPSENTPLIISNKDDDTWKKEDILKKSGILIGVYGPAKIGKTRFALSSVLGREIKCGDIILPKPTKIYVMDTENAAHIEAYNTYKNELANKQIIIKNAFVYDNQGNIKHAQTLNNFESLIKSLMNVNDGILIIDDLSSYYKLLNDILIEDVLGIQLNEYNEPVKRIRIEQWGWRNKKFNEIMRLLRLLKIVVICVVQGKNEWEKTGAQAFDVVKTERILPNISDDFSYWVDILCEMFKNKDEERFMVIRESRFENIIPKNKIISNPTYSKLLDLIEDKLNESANKENENIDKQN